MSIVEIMELLNLKDRKYFARKYLKPSIDGGYVELTIPEKPTSINQRYMRTERGKMLSFGLQ